MNGLLTGLIGISTTIVSSCSVGTKHVAPGYVRVEAVGRGIVDVPLEGMMVGPGAESGVDQHRIQDGYAVMSREGPQWISSPVLYFGSSGAPVYEGGELVGAAVRGPVHYKVGGPIGFNRIEDIERWGCLARRVTQEIDSGPVVPWSDGDVQPGALITVATYWGDLVNGTTGTVTLVDGEWLFAFGHGLGDFTGMRFGAVLPAEPLAVRTDVPFRDYYEIVVSTGEPVGGMVFLGPYGPVGVLGRLPPHFRVEFVFAGRRGPRLRKIVYFAANEDLAAELQPAVRALRPLVGKGNIVVVKRSGRGNYAWGDEGEGQVQGAVLWKGGDLGVGLRVILERAEAGEGYQVISMMREEE